MSRKMDLSAEDVLNICRTYMNEDSLDTIHRALELADRAHQGQKRLSGEPYIIHPIQVSGILAQLHMDPDAVATGFLHDVVEDTEVTLDQIREEFSESVAFLVDGVTKLGKLKFQSKQEAMAENHRKMLLAMAKDIRVIIVKLADRLHNMRTMKYQRKEKQIEKSQEALDIYAPLADRLGMSSMKWELEDIALRYINPDAYYSIVQSMDIKRVEREDYIQRTIQELYQAIGDFMPKAEIYGRPKHIYSIYRKMVDQNKEFEDIYDLLAIRVLVDTVRDCYGVLGAVHTQWKPMPGRFKDYIAMPKANMYQSIHTTVIGPDGRPVEIQIRTYQMHEVAENGVAAHWAYKEGRKGKVVSNNNIQKQLNWFKDLTELQDDAKDASEFMDFVKEDIFKDQVYIFTPQGDVVELAKGSGPIDFAYHIHTEIGNTTTGAKVNGNIVPLDYVLKNGDIVEILTHKNAKPSRDWLKITATSKAKNRIKRYFKTVERRYNLDAGRQEMDRTLKNNGRSLKEFETRKIVDGVLDRFNFSSLDDVYATIGLNELSPSAILHFLGWKQSEAESEAIETKDFQRELEVSKRPRQRTVHESGVVVEGAENLMIRISQCCKPVPGDPIIGYITRGRGISVHRTDCPNLGTGQEARDRTIDVHWDQDNISQDHAYETEIKLTGFNRNGLINDILQVVNHTSKKIININGRVNDMEQALVTLRVVINNITELEEFMTKLKTIPDIYTVERVSY